MTRRKAVKTPAKGTVNSMRHLIQQTLSECGYTTTDGPPSELTFPVSMLIGYMDDEPRYDTRYIRVKIEEVT